MKRYLTLAILALASLAACGGGGNSSFPVLGPGQPPSQTFQSRLLWSGGASTGEHPASFLRRIQTVGFATPVLLVSPQVDFLGNVLTSGNGAGGTLLVSVSPMPSSIPGVNFTINTTNVSAVPGPNPTAPPGYLAEEQIQTSTPNVASSGNAMATVSSPVSQTPTTPVIVYKRITMGCRTSGIGGNQIPGVTVANNGDVTENDVPANDDLYITGSACSGAFKDPNAAPSDNAIMHAPHGAMVIPIPPGGFSAMTAAMFVGPMTNTITYPDLANPNAIYFKNAADTLCRFDLVLGGLGTGQVDVTGPVACSGSSPDGF